MNKSRTANDLIEILKKYKNKDILMFCTPHENLFNKENMVALNDMNTVVSFAIKETSSGAKLFFGTEKLLTVMAAMEKEESKSSSKYFNAAEIYVDEETANKIKDELNDKAAKRQADDDRETSGSQPTK